MSEIETAYINLEQAGSAMAPLVLAFLAGRALSIEEIETLRDWAETAMAAKKILEEGGE